MIAPITYSIIIPGGCLETDLLVVITAMAFAGAHCWPFTLKLYKMRLSGLNGDVNSELNSQLHCI